MGMEKVGVQVLVWMHFVHNTSSIEVIIVVQHSVYKNSLYTEAVSQIKKLMIFGSLHGPC